MQFSMTKLFLYTKTKNVRNFIYRTKVIKRNVLKEKLQKKKLINFRKFASIFKFTPEKIISKSRENV